MKFTITIRTIIFTSFLVLPILNSNGQIILQKVEAYRKMNPLIKSIARYYIPYCEDTFDIDSDFNLPPYPSSISHYSREGNLIKWDEFNKNGSLNSYFSFNYDSLGRILNENSFEVGGELEVQHSYTYLNDSLVRINDQGDFAFITEWFRKLNPSGNVTEDYYYSDEGDSVNLLEIKYNINGLPIYEKRNYFNRNNLITSIEYNDSNKIIWKNVRENRSDITYFIEYDHVAMKETKTIWVKRTDEEPFLTKEIRFFDDNNLIYKIYYFSEFDLCRWQCHLNKFEFYTD